MSDRTARRDRSLPPGLLAIDHDAALLALIARVAAQEGFEVTTCGPQEVATVGLERRRIDLVLIDADASPPGGLAMVHRLHQLIPRAQIVVLTTGSGVATAVEAMQLGADDCLKKPFFLSRLSRLLRDVRANLDRPSSVDAAGGEDGPIEFQGMVSRNAGMRSVFTLVERLAPHAAAVLISGETGTGKSLIAHALHRLGPRSDRPLIRTYGSAFDERLLERAEGATLFLDDVGELARPAQTALLRALDRAGSPVHAARASGRQPRVLVLSTTSRDLDADVSTGAFRSDLFYRLNANAVSLPPLRARREDIPLLASEFLRDMALRLRKPMAGLSRGAEWLLAAATWPGNVRELQNAIERACIAAGGSVILESELREVLSLMRGGRPTGVDGPQSASDSGGSEISRERIVDVLLQSRGNRMAAARLLGISRRSLYRRLERYHIGSEAPPRRAYQARPR